jgi:hypothetical protein
MIKHPERYVDSELDNKIKMVTNDIHEKKGVIRAEIN